MSAIAQTPYTAFPGAATRLERIAGATTDLQHIVHQGLTYYDATFWVGANAVIRKRALDAIAETSYLGDWEIRRYIKDRTVIEDTESTIDMGTHGWGLFNCPERLSYSATPPDFGSLCIQRRRWANGGLLIVPKLRRQSRARRAAGERTRFGEVFLRVELHGVHLPGARSACWSCSTFPFSATLISPMLGLMALPYFAAMASDLRYCGYKRLDVLRIYGFNLILLPVNLAGTLSSIVQGITASKAPFAAHPQGAQPHGRSAVLRGGALPADRAGRPHRLLRLASPPGGEHGLRRAQRRAGLLRRHGVHRPAQLGWRTPGSTPHPLLYKPARRRRARAVQPPPPAHWRSVLEAGPAEPPAGPAARGPEPSGEPRRRLSLLRVLVALVVLGGVGYGGYAGVRTKLVSAAPVHQTWFAPYVDVTLTPTYQFQNPAGDPARQTVLGFVVAASGADCTPSWGGAYTLAQASSSLAVGSRIAQMQQDGAQPIVSFGGQAHTSLDVACPSAASLAHAYQQVIDAYQLTAIDLDIEGPALDDFAAGQRRAAAMADLQQAARTAHRPLSVWLTLPAEPSGLQGNALSVISSMLAATGCPSAGSTSWPWTSASRPAQGTPCWPRSRPR